MVHLLINKLAHFSVSIVGMVYFLFCTGILITRCGYFDLQILMTSNSFHQQFAKQTSSTVVTSDLFEAWYPGLWNKCHWVHGSFSGNPKDLHTGHTQSKPIKGLKNKSNNLYTKRVFLWYQQYFRKTEIDCWNDFTLTVNFYRCTHNYY